MTRILFGLGVLMVIATSAIQCAAPSVDQQLQERQVQAEQAIEAQVQ